MRAPFDGTVVEKHIALGEAVKEDTSIFTLADLRTVWAEFAVSPKDLALVRVGQKVRVTSSAFTEEIEGKVSYVGDLIGAQTRTARARVTLPNPQGAWRPGLFVTVSAAGNPISAAVVIPIEAIQSIDSKDVVFKKVEGGFEATSIKVGRKDAKGAEVLEGLKIGETVATSNAYILKSELGKASAEHAH